MGKRPHYASFGAPDALLPTCATGFSCPGSDIGVANERHQATRERGRKAAPRHGTPRTMGLRARCAPSPEDAIPSRMRYAPQRAPARAHERGGPVAAWPRGSAAGLEVTAGNHEPITGGDAGSSRTLQQTRHTAANVADLVTRTGTSPSQFNHTSNFERAHPEILRINLARHRQALARSELPPQQQLQHGVRRAGQRPRT